MIKKLRRKITAITMILLTVMLVVILVFMFFATKAGLEESAFSRLQSAAAQLGPHIRPGDGERWNARGCFVLRLSPEGELMAAGSDYYDLEDPDALLAILEKTKATGQDKGFLRDQNLRFLRAEQIRGVAYVYTDVSAEQETLSRLNLTCAMIFVVGVLGFFAVSILLAKWAVRPVERAWEQQRQFVADASHELKTPLTVILTNAELLNSDEHDETAKQQFAGSILTMSRQMRGLVEALLDQARVDNGRGAGTYVKLDLSRLVSDTLLPFEPVYFEAGRLLQYRIDPGVTATGDPEQLRRVVEVLLDNGCKYSEEGTAVELELHRHGRGSLLSIRSSGAPMTPQQCRDIFKRFYRMDTARTMNRSYGLGLSIAQTIVQQHCGKIWAESRDGINTFFVSLPQ